VRANLLVSTVVSIILSLIRFGIIAGCTIYLGISISSYMNKIRFVIEVVDRVIAVARLINSAAE